jgi:hypothetical protein
VNPDKKITTHFVVIFFQNLKTAGELFAARIVFSIDVTVHLLWHVDHYYVLRCGWGGGGRCSSLHAVVQDIRERTVSGVWYAIQTRSVQFPYFCFGRYIVTGVVYADILEEFLMLIRFLKKSFVMSAFWQDRGAPKFYIAVLDFMDQKFPHKGMDSGHLVPLTLECLIFSSGST